MFSSYIQFDCGCYALSDTTFYRIEIELLVFEVCLTIADHVIISTIIPWYDNPMLNVKAQKFNTHI